LWKEGTEIRPDVEDLTEAMFTEMEKVKMNPNLIKSFVHLMAIVDQHLDVMCRAIADDFVYLSTFESFQEETFLRHQHHNEKVVVPAEATIQPPSHGFFKVPPRGKI